MRKFERIIHSEVYGTFHPVLLSFLHQVFPFFGSEIKQRNFSGQCTIEIIQALWGSSVLHYQHFPLDTRMMRVRQCMFPLHYMIRFWMDASAGYLVNFIIVISCTQTASHSRFVHIQVTHNSIFLGRYCNCGDNFCSVHIIHLVFHFHDFHVWFSCLE